MRGKQPVFTESEIQCDTKQKHLDVHSHRPLQKSPIAKSKLHRRQFATK
jgi:hypothetical protein